MAKHSCENLSKAKEPKCIMKSQNAITHFLFFSLLNKKRKSIPSLLTSLITLMVAKPQLWFLIIKQWIDLYNLGIFYIKSPYDFMTWLLYSPKMDCAIQAFWVSFWIIFNDRNVYIVWIFLFKYLNCREDWSMMLVKETCHIYFIDFVLENRLLS